MENNDVKNNGKINGNGQKRRPPSQNGGGPQGVSSRNISRGGSGQASRQGAEKPGNQGSRGSGGRQVQGGQSRSTQPKRQQNGAQRRSGQNRGGGNTAKNSRDSMQDRQGQAPRQNQSRRPNTQGRVPQKKEERKGASQTAREQQPVKNQAQNTKNSSAQQKKRRRPDEYKRDGEPIIRRNDYGDGFYTDEVELKRRRQTIQERDDRQEELQKEPMSRRTRKMINIAICGVIVAVVLITGVVLSLTVLFKTEKITVEGSTHYTEQQIAQASGLTLGENLFLSDKQAGGERVEQKFPYVEKAEVSIKIPDTIVIRITEARPAYLLAQGNDFVVISTQGRVLEHASKNTFGAPIIKGCEITKAKVGETARIKDKKMLSILNTITKSLQKNKFEGIEEIDVTDAADISLNYANRIKIILGTPDDVDYKIRTAMTIISQKLAQTDMGVLDVSSCNSGKKASYYNPDSSLYPTEPVTEPATQPQTEPVTEPTEPDYGGGVVSGGDYGDPVQDSWTDSSSDGTNYGVDTDGDGVPDDFDGDGIPDYLG